MIYRVAVMRDVICSYEVDADSPQDAIRQAERDSWEWTPVDTEYGNPWVYELYEGAEADPKRKIDVDRARGRQE